MSCKIDLETKATFFLQKLAKKTPQDYVKLYEFLQDELTNCENPCVMAKAKYLIGCENPCVMAKARILIGYDENYYRWSLGDYRVIGIVTKLENGYLIQVTRIDKHKEDTHNGDF